LIPISYFTDPKENPLGLPLDSKYQWQVKSQDVHQLCQKPPRLAWHDLTSPPRCTSRAYIDCTINPPCASSEPTFLLSSSPNNYNGNEEIASTTFPALVLQRWAMLICSGLTSPPIEGQCEISDPFSVEFIFFWTRFIHVLLVLLRLSLLRN